MSTNLVEVFTLVKNILRPHLSSYGFEHMLQLPILFKNRKIENKKYFVYSSIIMMIFTWNNMAKKLGLDVFFLTEMM
jgi:hypothetical protein